jgi:hypothetical protein
MEKIDLESVSNLLNPKKIPYEPNKYRFRKVGFDVFQPDDGSTPSYWILHREEDGTEYLCADYENEEIKSKSSWSALSDRENQNITLSYKNIPIRRFAAAEFSFSPENAHIFKSALIDTLNESSEFVNKLLDTLPENKKNSLLRAFPELVNLGGNND